MRTTLILPTLAVSTLLAVGLHAQTAASPDSREWVARQVDDRDIGRTHGSRWRCVWSIVKGACDNARWLSPLCGSGNRGARVLVRFTSPNDIKGTGLLVWEHPSAEDERFLYLPSLGRVRRIAGSEKQESFVGSDLSYEDIGGRTTSPRSRFGCGDIGGRRPGIDA